MSINSIFLPHFFLQSDFSATLPPASDEFNFIHWSCSLKFTLLTPKIYYWKTYITEKAVIRGGCRKLKRGEICEGRNKILKGGGGETLSKL